MSFIDYFVNTYEERTRIQAQSNEEPNEDNEEIPGRRGGRPRDIRAAYQADHPRSSTMHRVIWSTGHRNLPNIIGPWLERNDDPTTYPLHCASVLACLKPWRALEELKSDCTSWTEALDIFLAGANEHRCCIQANIQYYYQCRDQADEALESMGESELNEGEDLDHIDLSEYVNGIELEAVV